MRTRQWLACAAAVWALVSPVRVHGQTPGFVGQTKCGNPTCHGASLPANDPPPAEWRPWKSARSQWLNEHIDRHSRAYRTLRTDESKQIAAYMGLKAAHTSDKCLVCHAPGAKKAAGGNHRAKDGVSCEHCHGAAEAWLEPHSQKDWPQKRSEYLGRGFYDNDDYRKRAEKCASCHVEIDHEIVAGGHPPLQFEMVAYAQIMKHWDDQDELPEGAASVDPTLWSMGQLVGLRRSVEMISRRAGSENYQSMRAFPHFGERECYQCHHKLVEDAVRQAAGHYAMAEVIFAQLFPDARGALENDWQALRGGVRSSAGAARQKADAMAGQLPDYEKRLLKRTVDRKSAQAILRRLTGRAEQLKRSPGFGYRQPADSNVIRVSGVELPWWHTTGGPEQAILAIQALCPPAFDTTRCAAIEPDLRKLVKAADRTHYDAAAFAQSLGALNRKLFK